MKRKVENCIRLFGLSWLSALNGFVFKTKADCLRETTFFYIYGYVKNHLDAKYYTVSKIFYVITGVFLLLFLWQVIITLKAVLKDQ